MLFAFWGLPRWCNVKNLPANAGDARDTDLIPGLRRSSGGVNCNLLQYSCLGKSHEKRSLVGYSSCGWEESDKTEQLSTHTHTFAFSCVDICVVILSLSHVRLLRTRGLKLTRLLCPWNSPGTNTGAGCHFLLQGNFLTQESNLVSCTAGEFFTDWA